MWLNYDEQYAVSDDGYVMNTKTGKILKGVVNNSGYLTLKNYNKRDTIHRMIALRFCPKEDLPGLEVDHINRDKTDNSAANLRWVSKSVNQRNKEASNISQHKSGYQVRFEKDRKYIHTSWHKTMELAVAARDAFKLTDAYML